MFAIGDVNTHCKPFISVSTFVYIYIQVVNRYITVSVCTTRTIKTVKSIAIEIVSLFSCGFFQTDSDEEDDMPAAKTLAPSKVSLVRVE